MPPAFLQDPGLRAVLAAIPDVRVVGGAVRDALAGRKVADVDLATPLPPDEVAARLERAGIRAVPTGIDHGTVTAVTPTGPIEITTLRSDEATDGRHATVAFTHDWKEDAARRDFTINAMSMAPDGTLYDYFGGADDLLAGRVRFVGDASRRIAEDYLRILRFFRFWARYGTDDPDADARAAIAAGVSGLSILSPERVWSELKRILAASDPTRAVALMAELGVLAAVLPDGADPAALAAVVASGAPVDPLLRLAELAQGDPDDLAERLRLSNDERDQLAALRDTALPRPELDDAALRRALADTPADILIGRSWLHGGGGPDWGSLRARLAAMPQPIFPLSGRDVVALGVAPGPAVGEALRAVRAWWLDNGCLADAQACTAELARQLALHRGR